MLPTIHWLENSQYGYEIMESYDQLAYFFPVKLR